MLEHADVVEELIEAVQRKPTEAPILALDGHHLEQLAVHCPDDADNNQRLTQLPLVEQDSLFDSGRGPRRLDGALVADGVCGLTASENSGFWRGRPESQKCTYRGNPKPNLHGTRNCRMVIKYAPA